ncbi:conserved hypothetical protein [Gammaproteobacteria bacterium]
MPYLSIKEAADSTGRSKSAILRSIQLGRVSANRDVFGQWRIDPTELYRVYDPIPEEDNEKNAELRSAHHTVRDKLAGAHFASDTELSNTHADEAIQNVEVNLLRELLEERDRVMVERDRLLAERDRQIAGLETMVEGLENVISDLMARLDQEAADRRRAYAQLTNLLTDQRAPAERGQQVVQNQRWWWRW